MKILTNSQIKEWDQYTIEQEPLHPLTLWNVQHKPLQLPSPAGGTTSHPVKVFAGPGNNGGDALAVARMLSEKGYAVEAYLFNTTGHLSDDCTTNRDLLQMCDNVKFEEVTKNFDPPRLSEGTS